MLRFELGPVVFVVDHSLPARAKANKTTCPGTLGGVAWAAACPLRVACSVFGSHHKADRTRVPTARCAPPRHRCRKGNQVPTMADRRWPVRMRSDSGLDRAEASGCWGKRDSLSAHRDNLGSAPARPCRPRRLPHLAGCVRVGLLAVALGPYGHGWHGQDWLQDDFLSGIGLTMPAHTPWRAMEFAFVFQYSFQYSGTYSPEIDL